MAIQAIGGVSSTAYTAPTSATAPADQARRGGDPEAKDSTPKDSTVVISRVTRTRDDGSTVTTITYADGHTKIETTPPKFSATEDQDSTAGGPDADGPDSNGTGPDQGSITAVDILA